MDKKPKTALERNLKVSFIEGIFASGMTGFTQEYFAPFLIVLHATARHIGMLNALPNLFASFIQLISANITERLKSRTKVINIFVFIQVIMLIPMFFIALSGGVPPLLFIMFVILFTSFGALANPAWGSLMSDLIAEDKRGEYFGWRNRTLGFITVALTFIAGLILHVAKRTNVFYGFALIFICAFIFRVLSWYFLRKMREPKLEFKKEHYFSFFDFIANMRKSNFAKFVLLVSMMSFSVNLASPFFVVLMLRDLHFSYLLYTVITVTATITIYSTIGRWGRHADKVGNLKIIKLTSQLIGFIPLLWIFNQCPFFLILAQIFSGFVWAGFNLCTINFIYDAVRPEKRTRCIAYFNVLNGFALCAGALLGGVLLQWLPPLFGYKILMLFLISSLCRLIVGFSMPPKLREVKSVKKIRSMRIFFSVIGIRPLLGIERKTIRY